MTVSRQNIIDVIKRHADPDKECSYDDIWSFVKEGSVGNVNMDLRYLESNGVIKTSDGFWFSLCCNESKNKYKTWQEAKYLIREGHRAIDVTVDNYENSKYYTTTGVRYSPLVHTLEKEMVRVFVEMDSYMQRVDKQGQYTIIHYRVGYTPRTTLCYNNVENGLELISRHAQWPDLSDPAVKRILIHTIPQSIIEYWDATAKLDK